MYPGLFIVLEGVEGAGKSTQRAYLAKYLKEEKGLEVVLTREPGGTPLAERIRELLLAPSDEMMHPKTEAMLFFAARNQHLEQIVFPALKKGEVVLCDRFVDSTYAYQAAGRRLDRDDIDPLTHYVLKEFRPDITFILKLDPTEGLRRAAARGRLDRIEQENLDFFERVALAFMEQAEREPDRYALIDANRPIDPIAREMMGHIDRLLERRKEQVCPQNQ